MVICWIPVTEYNPDEHPLPLAGEDIEKHFWVTIGDDNRIYCWSHPDKEFPAGFAVNGANKNEPVLVRHDKQPSPYRGMNFQAYLWCHEIKIVPKDRAGG